MDFTNIEASEIARLLGERYDYLFNRIKYFKLIKIDERHPDWIPLLQREIDVIDGILKKL